MNRLLLLYDDDNNYNGCSIINDPPNILHVFRSYLIVSEEPFLPKDSSSSSNSLQSEVIFTILDSYHHFVRQYANKKSEMNNFQTLLFVTVLPLHILALETGWFMMLICFNR